MDYGFLLIFPIPLFLDGVYTSLDTFENLSDFRICSKSMQSQMQGFGLCMLLHGPPSKTLQIQPLLRPVLMSFILDQRLQPFISEEVVKLSSGLRTSNIKVSICKVSITTQKDRDSRPFSSTGGPKILALCSTGESPQGFLGWTSDPNCLFPPTMIFSSNFKLYQSGGASQCVSKVPC
jgi:hypothetical protein